MFFSIPLLPDAAHFDYNYSDKVSSSKSLQDEELKNLIAQPLRAPKKKKKAAAAGKEETQA